MRLHVLTNILIICFQFIIVSTCLSHENIIDLIINEHPRIFFNAKGVIEKKNSIKRHNSELFTWLNDKMRHDQIPKKLEEIRDYIYKYGFYYQMTGNDNWARYVILALKQLPKSIQKYGGRNNGYAYAIEALSIGYDWCYEIISKEHMKQEIINLINNYYHGNKKNFERLSDYHNYAAQAQIAILLAGIATKGDNPNAERYINEARQIFEFGKVSEKFRNVTHNVLKSINFVDGACNWEGPTYSRRNIFAYVKYVESIKSATNNRINLWKSSFRTLENAGYYIMYSLQSNKRHHSVGDVNYNALMYFDVNNLSILQSVFKNPYFTTFLLENVKWSKNKKDGGIWPGRYRAPVIFYLLWFDPDIESKSLNELPLSKKFGSTIILRDGFDRNDTMITYQCGYHWGFHSQLDHGSFTIFKGNSLAIDSGYYDNWRWGKKHNWNYWKRTIAHNTLIVSRKEPFETEWPPGHIMEDDGGQRIPFVTNYPPHRKKGSHNRPLSINDLLNRPEEFEMGNIVVYESDKNYMYIKSDLTKAYDNIYSGQGKNPPKRVNKIFRSLIYIKSGEFIIFDEIQSNKNKLQPKWLLHSGDYYSKKGIPIIYGAKEVIAGNDKAGITLSKDTERITIINKESKLDIHPVLPKKLVTKRIGGQGYEFWYNNTNHTFAQNEIPPHRRGENPGAWRIELYASQPKIRSEFINVLIPGLKTDNESTEIKSLPSTNGSDYRGLILSTKKDNKIIVFVLNKENKELTIKTGTKTLDKNMRYYIVGTEPSSFYTLEFNNTENSQHLIITKSKIKKGVQSSINGVLVKRY